MVNSAAILYVFQDKEEKREGTGVGERILTLTESFFMSNTLLSSLYGSLNSDNKPYEESISIPVLQILKLSFRVVIWSQICLNSRKCDRYVRVTGKYLSTMKY